MRQAPTCESSIKSLNTVTSCCDWCPICLMFTLSFALWNWSRPSQPSAILSPDFCSTADILKLVSIHFTIQMVPWGEILYLSLESVGESSGTLDLEHERTSCSILWDLGPPRKNPRTEEPLITTSLPSVLHLQIQYPTSRIRKLLLQTLPRLKPCAVTWMTSRRSLTSHVAHGRATPYLANLVELFLTPIWWPAGLIVNWQE